MKKNFTYLFIIIIALINKASAQRAGLIDSTFHHTGYNVILNSDSNNNAGYALAVQADGKTVVAGSIQLPDTTEVLVERYKTNGTLDSEFYHNGSFYFLTGRQSKATAIALQSDGKIVIGGSAFISGDQDDFLLLRLNTNGTLDNSFGINGVVTVDFTDGQQDDIYCLAIQPDGKILAGGTAFANGNYNFAVARFNNDGTLDYSFSDARVYTHIGDAECIAYAMALQADGKILLGGYSVNDDSETISTICRYTTTGVIDSTFNGNGIVITPVSPYDNFVYGLAVQPDGKIISSGSANNNQNYGDFALARYNTNGTLDNTFNGTGIVTTDFNGEDDVAYTVNLQADGKIIACGFAGITTQSREIALARYNSNGSLDGSFGNAGLVKTEVGGKDDQFFAAGFQPDGKLVATGFSFNSAHSNTIVARYLTGISTGVLDFNAPIDQYLIYPNPANENTQLEYELLNTESISVNVFDVTGKLISTVLNNETQPAGRHSLIIHFDNRLASGTYFVRIAAANGQVTIKMVKE